MDTAAYLDSLFSLKGKTILITGAAGGIGAAISAGVARAGAEAALCGRTRSKCETSHRVPAGGGLYGVRQCAGCGRPGQHFEHS